MASTALINKFFNTFKLNGLNIRRELCSLIVEKFTERQINLTVRSEFDEVVNKICRSLENQCISDTSIERDHIERAIEVCLNAGYDRHETIFNVIGAFDFPRLEYNEDRKTYSISNKKGKLLSDANSKAKLFLERYSTVLQRTRRNLAKSNTANQKDQLKLETVDYLLTQSQVTLECTLILGSLLQVSDGKYYLEDPTGIVQLDLEHVKYQSDKIFVENCFVLVNGLYEDQILHVASMMLPSGEEYKLSRVTFGNINYFGGMSNTPLRDSVRLEKHLADLSDNKKDMIFFFSDVWLDHPLIFEKLKVLFDRTCAADFVPFAFVFMGNFLSESYGSKSIDVLKNYFKQLAELISKYQEIQENSQFVFVPGFADPCCPHMVPRLGLPNYITGDFQKLVPKSTFTTNPTRIQFCSREIVVFRSDLITKLLQGALIKTFKKASKDGVAEASNRTSKEDMSVRLTRTIIGEGHLTPLPLNALTVHWEFDYCLRLYPLPDLVVIGDKADAYQSKYKDCVVASPGSFCQDFNFQIFYASKQEIEDCFLSDLEE